MYSQQKPPNAAGGRFNVCEIFLESTDLVTLDESQKLTEGRWKEKMEERIKSIENSVSSSTNSMSTFEALDTVVQQQNASESSERQLDDEVLPSVNREVSLNLSCSLGAFPASSFNGLAQNDSPQAFSSSADLANVLQISARRNNSMLASSSAEQHFRFYREHLDQHIHYLLRESDKLSSVRARSHLLATSLCTAAAFCSGSKDYPEWLDDLKIAVAGKVFSKQHSFDDVRALCIGAFWLSDIATSLNSLGKFSLN